MDKEPTYTVRKIEGMIPLCYKCSSKIAVPSPKDKVGGVVPFILVGCTELTKEEWEAGNRESNDGIYYQHNCPLHKEQL